jgi:hypothetical protein
MAQFIIGGILIAVGVFISLFIPWRIKNKNIELKFMQTTSIGELINILTENARAGLEGYRHYVELKGLAGSEKPQEAPFSNKKVAYYDAKLYQVYEEEETRTDSKGTTRSIKKNETLVTDQKSSNQVFLKDAGSQEKVDIDISQSGLQLGTLKTLDKFEPVNNINRYRFFGNYKYKNMGLKTLGFRMVENTIPLGQSLYVLGEAVLEGPGRVIVGKPADSKKPFIVSVKKEEDIIQANRTGARVALIIGIIIAVAGILVMIFMK